MVFNVDDLLGSFHLSGLNEGIFLNSLAGRDIFQFSRGAGMLARLQFGCDVGQSFLFPVIEL